MEGLYLSSKDVITITKYLTFATPKQKLDIKRLSKKDQLTQKEYNRNFNGI